MKLQDKLTALKEENLAKFPEDVKSKLTNDLQNLIDSGIVERAPKAGEKLTEFSLQNHKGKTISLSELRENGPVVVTFYRGGWCPYCNLELRAYQEALSEIKAAGATLVAITPELPDESLTTSERHNLEFEVLTDTNSNYSRDLGIVFTIPEEIVPIYESFGIDVEKHNGKGQYDIPLASTFIVNTDGVITYSFVNADYTLRAEPAVILNELKLLSKKETV